MTSALPGVQLAELSLQPRPPASMTCAAGHGVETIGPRNRVRRDGGW